MNGFLDVDVNLLIAFVCPPKETTVRMAENVDSAIAPASPVSSCSSEVAPSAS